MEMKSIISETWTPKITRQNVLGWLRLMRVVYDLTDEQKKKLDKFINTRYTVRRDKLLDEIFMEENDG